jgi:hypothetical protein
MDTSDFPEIWKRFTGELDARRQRLYSEIDASWNILHSILQKHSDKISGEEWYSPPADSLASILNLAKTRSSILLFEPLALLKKARPLERALNAIDSYQSDIEDILRLLPDSIIVSRKDLLSSLDWKGKPVRRLILHFGKKPLQFNIRKVVRRVLLEHSAQRVTRDGQMLLLLLRATLSLLIPWQFVRNDALKTHEGNQDNLQACAEARSNWLQMIMSFDNEGALYLAAYGNWWPRLSGCLASALFSGDGRLSDRRNDRAIERWQNCFRYWSGKQRVLGAQLSLESSAARLLEKAIGIAHESLASVNEEHAQLLSELDKASKWLGNWQSGDSGAPFPSPEAHLVSSEDRVLEWVRRLETAGRAALPAHIELVNLKQALPGRRKQWRSIATESYFSKSLSDIGRRIALTGFGEAEEGHRAIVREIERAREVAAYSFEVGKSEGETEESRQVVRDGIANALSLLAYQKKTIADSKPFVERRLTEALGSVFLEFHLRMEESRLGLFKLLARQKGRQAIHTGTEATLSRITAALRWLSDRLERLNKFILAWLGWSPPSTIAVEPVVRREYLGEVLNLKAGPRELPAIYKRLFRLAPVEDQRFLVGREAEMAATAEARAFWEEGRSVAILVAGARGSGKTSFLNCARSAVFGDLPVVSGQFRERMTTAAGMRSFLSSLLQVDVAELDHQLKSEKRLIILEEAERTFVRCIGGFSGLRTLLNLISETSRHTLWILSLNETALLYLTRIVAMEEYFSHRINAMAVPPEHLRNAILLRHNLSGLRLHFEELSSLNSRSKKIRDLLRLEKDTEGVYFDSLYRQSEGIFRSAFELWQQSVDRVEGGVLYMLNPPNPSYDEMISRWTTDDAFLLQAILQHGSLTPEEIALIFDYSLERSRSRIGKLIAWEILEPDPNNPGFRIRPEAGRIVREALYRQNLI